MTADEFVARLEKARRTGNGTWIACCPAHEDKSPSLTVRELPDQRILVHCFAGCGVDEVVGSMGLELHDLFPEKTTEQARPLRRPFPAGDVLEALAGEAMVLGVILHDIDWAVPLKQDDIERAQLAVSRILAGRSLALGD